MDVLFTKVGGLGDSLSVLPAVAALAQRTRVTVLCSPVGAGVFRSLTPAPRVVSVPRPWLAGVGGLRHVPALVRRVGRAEAAVISFDDCTAVHAVAGWVAPRRIGVGAGIAKGEVWLTDRVPFQARRSVYAAALTPVEALLGHAVPLNRGVPWPVERGAGAYGVIHPGAATALQRWPGFAALAGRLERATGFPWRCVTEADGLTVADLARLIGGARCFVGNHSGPLHLAAAQGTPYVALAGPTTPAWDPPWTDVPGRVLRAGLPCQPCGRLGAPARRCPARMRDGVPPCLARLTGEHVSAAVAEVLDG